MNAPCKNCEDRHTGCHAECEKYKAFAEEREKHRQERGLKTASMPELPRKVVKQIWKEERWK